MRPPSVSLFFFFFAIAFIIYGAISVRQQAGLNDSALDHASPVAAESAAIDLALPDFTWRFNALDPGLISAASASVMFDPADDYWGLPRTDGVELIAGYCAACHSLRIVIQQSASEARWRELMAWMVEKQGMARPPDDDFELIIAYLSAHFGE